MIKTLLYGVLLTVLVTGLMVVAWGGAAVIPGVSFGLLATAIQVAAWMLLVPVSEQPFGRFAGRWVAGMALRLLGVVLVFVAIGVWRDLYPPFPTAIGYLGVVIPSLFLEVRRFL